MRVSRGQLVAVVVLAVAALVVLVIGWQIFGDYARADGDGDPACPSAQKHGVGSVKPAKWRLENTGGNRLAIALEDWINEPRRDSTWVRVTPTASNTAERPLRGKHRVRAFVLRRPSTGGRSLQFD